MLHRCWFTLCAALCLTYSLVLFRSPPPRGRTGQRIGTAQLAFVNECMDRVSSVFRLLRKCAAQTLIHAETLHGEVMQSLYSLAVVPYCRTRTSAKVLSGSAAGPSAAVSASHGLIADMVGFPDTLIPFDPRRFLCDDSCSAYADPIHSENPEETGGPEVPPFVAPVDEVTALAKRWDKVDRHAICSSIGAWCSRAG